MYVSRKVIYKNARKLGREPLPKVWIFKIIFLGLKNFLMLICSDIKDINYFQLTDFCLNIRVEHK